MSTLDDSLAAGGSTAGVPTVGVPTVGVPTVGVPTVEAGQKQPAGKPRHRVVALINPNLHCRATCAELINAGVNLVGIVEAQTKTGGLPVANFKRLVKKQGLTTTASQVAARLAYNVANRSKDRRLYEELFNRDHIESTLRRWNGPVVTCTDYAESSAMAAIQQLSPDILVVHSQSWVTRKVRELAATGLVIGGHPGITPHYRGSHSSFWALLNKQPEMVGWTAFHVDKGVDTGDVIVQGRLEVQPDDSYVTLNWRGMVEIAKAQAAAISNYDQHGIVSRIPHAAVPDDSEFGLPGVVEYLRYRRSQSLAR